jgi:hypothetical protein
MQLKIGMFSLGQLLPLAVVAFILIYLTIIFNWPFYVGLLLFASLAGLMVSLLGDRPWLFLHKFAATPEVVRGGCKYYPLLPRTNLNYFTNPALKGRGLTKEKPVSLRGIVKPSYKEGVSNPNFR